MRMGSAAQLIRALNANWQERRPSLELAFDGDEIANLEGHPLEGELTSICAGGDASLPYFATPDQVKWCTLAPRIEQLRKTMSDLRAWVLPSFGWETDGDGIITPSAEAVGIAAELLRLSPQGYFRWTSDSGRFEVVAKKLSKRRHLRAMQPTRSRPIRASLYELRSRYSTALLVGDRNAAEEVINEIDLYQLDSAANTQFMRIRLWYQFREFERIVRHPELARLRSQLLPANVSGWIQEALDAMQPGTAPAEQGEQAQSVVIPELTIETWDQWLLNLASGAEEPAQRFLGGRDKRTPGSLTASEIQALVTRLEELSLDDALLKRRRDLIHQGLAEFLQDYVREPEFPRARLGSLYLAILRLWSTLHAGTGSGEESHVLLELAGAALQLNREPSEVLEIIHQWWNARKVPAQLPFLLDAIELLEREHPERQAPLNLWVEAAEFVRREPERLTPSEKDLWRRVGQRLGMGQSTITEYLPQDEAAAPIDILKEAKLKKVAIVCMRERQAADAAKIISQRAGVEVVTVSAKAVGEETDRALGADVVLFVWMASSHAVFRAFDGFDRKKFCYVQGTGSSSIVRSLERWALPTRDA